MEKSPIDMLVEHFSKQTLHGKPVDVESLRQHLMAIETGGCEICEQKSFVLSMFAPKDPVEYGGIDGKTRNIFYSLCEEHFNKVKNEPGFSDRLDEFIKARLPKKH